MHELRQVAPWKIVAASIAALSVVIACQICLGWAPITIRSSAIAADGSVAAIVNQPSRTGHVFRSTVVRFEPNLTHPQVIRELRHEGEQIEITADGKTVFVQADAATQCLDAKSGEVRWELPYSGAYTSYLISDDRIFLHILESADVIFLNAHDGTEIDRITGATQTSRVGWANAYITLDQTIDGTDQTLFFHFDGERLRQVDRIDAIEQGAFRTSVPSIHLGGWRTKGWSNDHRQMPGNPSLTLRTFQRRDSRAAALAIVSSAEPSNVHARYQFGQSYAAMIVLLLFAGSIAACIVVWMQYELWSDPLRVRVILPATVVLLIAASVDWRHFEFINAWPLIAAPIATCALLACCAFNRPLHLWGLAFFFSAISFLLPIAAVIFVARLLNMQLPNLKPNEAKEKNEDDPGDAQRQVNQPASPTTKKFRFELYQLMLATGIVAIFIGVGLQGIFLINIGFVVAVVAAIGVLINACPPIAIGCVPLMVGATLFLAAGSQLLGAQAAPFAGGAAGLMTLAILGANGVGLRMKGREYWDVV